MTTTGMIADAIIAIDENAYYCGDYKLVDGNYKMDVTVDHDLNVIFNRIEKRKYGNWRTVNSVPDGFDIEELISFIKKFSLIKKMEIERAEELDQMIEEEIKSIEYNLKQINWAGTMAGY